MGLLGIWGVGARVEAGLGGWVQDKDLAWVGHEVETQP